MYTISDVFLLDYANLSDSAPSRVGNPRFQTKKDGRQSKAADRQVVHQLRQFFVRAAP
jgi:hypothetical protein